jgi:hypothetical protein
MRRPLLAFCLLLVAITAKPAFADEEEESAPLSATPIEDKSRPKINPVERGLFMGAVFGEQFYFAPPKSTFSCPTGATCASNFVTGQAGGFEVGYNQLPFVDLSLLLWGANANTPSTFTTADPSNASAPHGNFTTLTVGASAKLNLNIGKDVNDVPRFYFYVRAGAGYSLVFPKGIMGNELLVFGGPGIEYFTHLRHFSLGIEADATFGLSNKGFATVLQPLVRYSF